LLKNIQILFLWNEIEFLDVRKRERRRRGGEGKEEKEKENVRRKG